MVPCDELSEECVLVARADLLEIVRLLRPLLRNDNTVSELIRGIHHTSENHSANCAGSLMAVARQIYLRRRARDRHFPKTLFGEPGWDMLLALYATAGDDRKQTVSGLADFAGSSLSTALRYMSVLSEEGFIERLAHPSDGRVSWVSLSSKGKTAIEGYLISVLESHRL